jgi:hypothetical protein
MILQFAANPKFHDIPLRHCGAIGADALAYSAFGECRPFRAEARPIDERSGSRAAGISTSALKLYDALRIEGASPLGVPVISPVQVNSVRPTWRRRAPPRASKPPCDGAMAATLRSAQQVFSNMASGL